MQNDNLSQLVRACGDKFTNLVRLTKWNEKYEAIGIDHWGATYQPISGHLDDALYGKGSTPEEAVNNLLLKLNKHE